MIKAKTIEAYIAAAPEAAKVRLKELRAAVSKGAPTAEEGIKWGMPALSTTRILVMFGAFKKHVGVFPTAAVLKAHAKEIAKYERTSGGVKFPMDKPVPAALVTKLTKARVKDNAKNDALWKTGGVKKKPAAKRKR
ncbi:MAG: DUF1801 domain-containing protein [Candidatus Acidiferrales bacterium]